MVTISLVPTVCMVGMVTVIRMVILVSLVGIVSQVSRVIVVSMVSLSQSDQCPHPSQYSQLAQSIYQCGYICRTYQKYSLPMNMMLTCRE